MAEVSPELLERIATGNAMIDCSFVARFGYPEQYNVNQQYLAEHGWVYDITTDVWLKLPTVNA